MQAEYRFVRQWATAVAMAADRYSGKQGLTVRAVLLAVGAAAQMRGARHVAFGQRSLSLAAGRDHTRVGAALHLLRAETDPFLVLLDAGRGRDADLYELRIPDQYAAAAATRPWPKGLIPRVHAAFAGPHGLGLPAFFVHQALSRHTPTLAADLEPASGLSRSQLYRALDVLADAGLARRVRGGWRRGRGHLDTVAEQLGAHLHQQTLRDRYTRERAAWQSWLLGHGLITHLPRPPAVPNPAHPVPEPRRPHLISSAHNGLHSGRALSSVPPSPDPAEGGTASGPDSPKLPQAPRPPSDPHGSASLLEPPEEHPETTLQLLERELGGHCIAVIRHVAYQPTSSRSDGPGRPFHLRPG